MARLHRQRLPQAVLGGKIDQRHQRTKTNRAVHVQELSGKYINFISCSASPTPTLSLVCLFLTGFVAVDNGSPQSIAPERHMD